MEGICQYFMSCGVLPRRSGCKPVPLCVLVSWCLVVISSLLIRRIRVIRGYGFRNQMFRIIAPFQGF